MAWVAKRSTTVRNAVRAMTKKRNSDPTLPCDCGTEPITPDVWDMVLPGGGPHILRSLGSCRMSNDSNMTGLPVVFFHQCAVPRVSRATSPALCTIGTEQLLLY